MKTKPITVTVKDNNGWECDTVITVPKSAMEEAGRIKMLSAASGAQSKHAFHALAQMAFMQFQDDELEISEVEAPIKIRVKDDRHEITSGMVICRTLSGQVIVLVHGGQPQQKLLEAAHRYCTRWVRLDI